jgi:alpha-L-rhamnosidase
LNGQRVGQQQLAPGWTDYRKRVQYQTYDVTRLLRRGPNAAGAILGDGWYAGSLGPDLKRNHFGPYPLRLRLQLYVEFQDGTSRSVVSDATWQGTTGPIRASDLYAGETYDARLERPGWDTAMTGRDQSPQRVTLGWRESVRGSQAGPRRPPPSDWRPVSVLTDQDPALSAQVGPPIRVTGEVATRRVTEPQPGRFVFDLGQNLVGIARLRVRGSRGTRVTMRFGEVLNPDGTVYRANLRRARATDQYTLRGGGDEVFEPHFTYHGFRYVEVTGYPGRPGPAAISGRVFHSDLPATSFFSCSSDLVNQLQQNIVWGQRGNLMSVPTDCPQRDERLGWMGDAELFARTACFNMEMAAFFTKWMRDIVDAQSPEGFFSDVSPRVVDLADGAPSWADAGIIVPWTVWQCYGDTRIIDRNFAAMARYVDLLVRANPDLLWLKRRNNDFGDWVAAGGKTSKDLIASAYLAYDLRLLAEMARATGREADAVKYGDLARKSRDAFNARFGGADGHYTSDSQTAYAMVLGMDLAPREHRAAVADRLVEAVRRADDHLSTGFIGTAFLLPALSETGHNDLAYRLLLQRTYPSWGYMIDRGATTIWELWNSDVEGPAMNSRNHFAFGTVGEWLQRSVAGIDTDPVAPGYRRVVIRPRPGPGVTAAEASYAAGPGRIASAWSRTSNGLRLTVTLPANTTATVYLPRAGVAAVRVLEGGRPVWQADRFVSGVAGITAARDVGDAVAFDVDSGSYHFDLQTP